MLWCGYMKHLRPNLLMSLVMETKNIISLNYSLTDFGQY